MIRCTALARPLALALLVCSACAGAAQLDAAPPDAGEADSGPVVPVPPPLGVACEQLDALVRACMASCAPAWDCRTAYAGLDPLEQVALESCADCLLAGGADGGTCADCADSAAGVTSCRVFLEELLAVDCW